MPRIGLRAQFLAAGLVVLMTTIASGLWSAVNFSRLSRVVGETLRDSDETTSVTSQLATALEREDDALLMAIAGETSRAEHDLKVERANVEAARSRVGELLNTSERPTYAPQLQSAISDYHAAGDRLVANPSSADALARYHREVNPLLRKAVAQTGRIRDAHFHATQAVATWARDESWRATWIVSAISIVAFGLAVGVALLLARMIVWPVRELIGAANAIRAGDFNARVRLSSRNELGALGDTFNRMAEQMAEFHRSNMGEVIRAKETLESTLAVLPDAVVVVDEDGSIISMNSAASQVVRADPARAAPRIEDLPLPPAAMKALRDAMRGSRVVDSPIDLSKAISLTVNGRERRLLPRVVPVPLSSKRNGAVLVLYEVTELARLDEMRMELVAVASHELRTPLTTMRMSLLMLAEGDDDLSSRQKALLATASMGLDQLSGTIDEYLDLTRIEAGQLRLNREAIDAGALIGQAVRAFRTQLDESGIKVHVVVDDGTAPLWGDGARLTVVLSNILSNALKYTSAGGAIEVHAGPAASAAGREVELSIADSGPGIPQEFHERVFEKFFRVEHHGRGSSEEGVRGSGIGLYLCREIVEAHGGTIRCEQGSGGIGVKLVLRLPVAGRHEPSFAPGADERGLEPEEQR